MSKFEIYLMPFGVHKNKMMSEVPKTYLHWLLKQDWVQPDTKNACYYHLGEQAPKRQVNKKKSTNWRSSIHNDK